MMTDNRLPESMGNHPIHEYKPITESLESQDLYHAYDGVADTSYYQHLFRLPMYDETSRNTVIGMAMALSPHRPCLAKRKASNQLFFCGIEKEGNAIIKTDRRCAIDAKLKTDLSISMTVANVLSILIVLPPIIVLAGLFLLRCWGQFRIGLFVGELRDLLLFLGKPPKVFLEILMVISAVYSGFRRSDFWFHSKDLWRNT